MPTQAATQSLEASRQASHSLATDWAELRNNISFLEGKLAVAKKRMPEIEAEKKRAAANKVISLDCTILCLHTAYGMQDGQNTLWTLPSITRLLRLAIFNTHDDEYSHMIARAVHSPSQVAGSLSGVALGNRFHYCAYLTCISNRQWVWLCKHIENCLDVSALIGLQRSEHAETRKFSISKYPWEASNKWSHFLWDTHTVYGRYLVAWKPIHLHG